MSIKKIFTALLIFCTVTVASAQTIQDVQATIQQHGNIVKTKYATAKSMLGIAEMSGDQNQYKMAQIEIQLHENYYAYLEKLYQNPSQLLTQETAREFFNRWNEYSYRTDNRDYRPYQQIVSQLHNYVARRTWESSTPEGNRAFQNRMVQNQRDFQTNQAAHNERVAEFDSQMNRWHANSRQNDKNHRQYVNGIHDRYEYVNPYDGQGYYYPNTQSGNPVMQNPDGSYTELVPYQNY